MSGGINVRLTKLEVAASLGAVEAVADAAPGAAPEPLRSAAEKYERALAELNGKARQQDKGGTDGE